MFRSEPVNFDSSNFWLQDWTENGFVPQNLSLVAQGISSRFLLYLTQKLIGNWPQFNSRCSINHTATFRIYTNLNVPLNLIPPMPIVQLQYGPKVALPFTSASKFGILGLKTD